MSTHSLFYENDLPQDIDDIEHVADYFSISVTDKDIWNVARENEDPPHLDNVYMEILFSRLQAALEEAYPEFELKIDYSVNALASYFNVHGQRVCCVQDLLNRIA